MSIELALTLHARDQRSDAPASVADISPVVGRWAEAANPDALIESGEWNGVGRSKDRLTAEKLDVGAGAPWAWVFHRHHDDDGDHTVTWVVTVEVVEDPSAASTEIGIVLARESSETRVRPLEADDPEPPRLIRDLIETTVIECVDGDIPLWAEPRTLKREYVGEFIAELMNPSRRLPVIGVSINPDTNAPIVDVERLARRVAGMAHVWFVPPDVTWAVSEQLPAKLGVFNGAVRVWWPGLAANADPYAHHLFMRGRSRAEGSIVSLVHRASTDRYMPPRGVAAARAELRRREEEALLKELEDLARPEVEGGLDPEVLARLRDRITVLQGEVTVALELAALEEGLRKDAESKYWALRNDPAVRRALEGGDDDVEADATDPTEAFLDEVRSAWRRQVCTSDADRREYPLLAVQLHSDFLKALDQVHGIDREKVVRVCAEVACDRAKDIPGRDVHALRADDSGGSPARVRVRDGARAWRGALQRGTAAARRLHWWRIPGASGASDTIEFAHVGYHDDFACPE